MRKPITVIILFIIGLTSCKTPAIVVSDELKSNAAPMDVKGRQGFQFNQVITYGDFSTSKIKRGWTNSADIRFITHFSRAEEKLNFTQNAPDNRHAEVFAVGKFKSNEIELLNGFMSYSLAYDNSFAGTIIPADKETSSWEFIIHNPEASLPRDADCGAARDNHGNEILITGVKKLENQNSWFQMDNFGFEFLHNGHSIGAVSVMNSGKVWIRNDIPSELKLVVSSISTSLLVRHSMQESAAGH